MSKQSKCELCGKRTASLFALPTPSTWSKSICRGCVANTNFARWRRIDAELDRQRFKVDETWSLYGWYPDDHDDARYKAAAKLVDEREMAAMSGGAT